MVHTHRTLCAYYRFLLPVPCTYSPPVLVTCIPFTHTCCCHLPPYHLRFTPAAATPTHMRTRCPRLLFPILPRRTLFLFHLPRDNSCCAPAHRVLLRTCLCLGFIFVLGLPHATTTTRTAAVPPARTHCAFVPHTLHAVTAHWITVVVYFGLQCPTLVLAACTAAARFYRFHLLGLHVDFNVLRLWDGSACARACYATPPLLPHAPLLHAHAFATMWFCWRPYLPPCLRCFACLPATLLILHVCQTLPCRTFKR